MLNLYCSVSADSIVEKVELGSNILVNTDTFFNIIVNIIVILGGILGFKYIVKLREKQIDSAFSYLTRLNIRLEYFHEILAAYKDEVMDRFLPENHRREIAVNRVSLVANTIMHLSESAKETLKFFRDENDQMPAQEGWVDCLNQFIKFLIDIEQLDQDSYFKWIGSDTQEKELYYNKNFQNIEALLEMVYNCQCDLEKNIFKNKK